MAQDIDRVDRPVPGGYGQRSRAGRDADIGLGLAVCVLLVAGNTLAPSATTVWRAALGLLATLVLPGYFFVEMLFPRRRDIDTIARWVLVLVMSGAIIVIVSLLISLAHQHSSRFGLDVADTTDSVCGVIVLFGAVAWWRRRHVAQNEASGLTIPRGWAPFAALAFAVLLVALTWSVTTSTLGDNAPALALTNPGGQLYGYPFQVRRGERYPLRILVTNPTGGSRRFRLTVRDARGTISTQTIVVPAGGSWSRPAPLPSDVVGAHEVVSVVLYENGKPVRRVQVRYEIVP